MPKDKLSIEIEIKKIGEGLEQVKREMAALGNQVKVEGAKIHAETTRINAGFKGLSSVISQAKNLLIGFGAIGVLRGISNLITSVADAGDQFAKMSQRLGVSVETLSTFDHVAKLSGLTLEEVAVGLRRFAANALDMSRGIGEAKRDFEALKISVVDSQGKLKSVEQLILEVANRFEKMEDGTTKTAMAMNLFGRSGSEMIPMLNQGAAGLREMMDEAKELGLVFTEESAKAAEEFNDNLTRLKGSFRGLSQEIGNEAIPKLSDFTNKLTGLIQTMKEHRSEIGLAFKVWLMMLDPGRAIVNLYKEFGEGATKARGKIDDLVEATIRKKGAVTDLNKVLEDYLKKIGAIERTGAETGIGGPSEEAIKLNEKLRSEVIKLTKTKLEQLDIWRQEMLAIRGINREYVDLIYNIQKEKIETEAVVEATKKASALNERLRDEVVKLTKTKLEQLDIWRQEQLAIAGVNEEYVKTIYNIKRETLEREANIEAAKKYTQEWLEAYKKTDDYWAYTASKNKEVTDQIKLNWESVRQDLQWSLEAGFFDLFKGGIKDIEDFFRQFCNNLVDSFARAVSKMITEWLVFKAVTQIGGAVSGLFGGGSPEVVMAQHGLMINEPILGIGQSGQRYLFGEAGPEAVVPAGNLGMGNLNLNVVVENKSSAPVEARADEYILYNPKMREAIIKIAIEDISSDGPLRRTIKRYG